MIRPVLPRRRAPQLHTWLIVVGVLLAAPMISIAMIYVGIPPLLLVAAAVAAAGVVLVGRSSAPIESGILLMVVAALTLSAIYLPTGRNSELVISLVLALALLTFWFLQMLVVERKIALKPSPVNRPLLAFVAVSIVSYLWSLVMRDELLFVWPSFPVVQIAALVVNICLPLVLLLVANHYDHQRWIQRLMVAFLGLSILATALYLFSPSTHALIFGRGTSGLWSMWAAVMAYGLALFARGLKPWQRLLLLIFTGLQVYLYFFVTRNWVSGWLPMGVACAVLTLMRSRRLFFVCLVAGLIYGALNFDALYESTFVAQEAEGSGSARVQLWVTNLTHVRNHPLFGMGPAGYAPYNMTYHASDARSTHNNYFDILAQVGIVGALIFIWLALTLLRVGWQGWRALSGRRDLLEAFSAAAFAGLIGALVGMMLGDWVLPFAYNTTISGFDNAVLTWVFLGCMVGLHRRYVVERRAGGAGGTGGADGAKGADRGDGEENV
jgi:O-antigen ligase